MAILWDENLRTGIDILDEQHKKLFRIAGKFEKIKRSKTMFMDTLEELESYVDIHFDTEEKFMKKLNYADYESHKAAHEKFKLSYKRLVARASGPEDLIKLAFELTTFLETWIREHYTSDDVKLALFLKENLDKI